MVEVENKIKVGKKWLDRKTEEIFKIAEINHKEGYIVDTDDMRTDIDALRKSPDLEPLKEE